MKIHTTIGKIIYWLGFILFICGLGTSLGSFDYNSFIPNKSVALICFFIGIAFLLTSNFFKKRTNQ
ncbi:hypothetical protein ACQKMV_12875 [Lysinibacillus sp. NPDC094403]|uniref:hypothetical protein n=1 Tax=Lysinibacillus sp. NPDC094403 TaxID=3390581 RepID=UPI003CFCBFD6